LIESGIHFGLPAPQYHEDPALGSTSLKRIALDPTEFQYERLHGEEKDTLALLWGKAIHSRVLEGVDAFKRDFLVAPAVEDYPNALVTMEHLRAHAQKMDIKKLGRSKSDAIAAIRQFDGDVQIWDEIEAAFLKTAESRIVLSKKIVGEIEQAAQWMCDDPTIGPTMREGTFVVGASEVSIFHEHNGVRLKARLDRLFPHAIVDVKSFRTIMRDRIQVSCMKAVARERYDLQAASYIRAFRAAHALFKAGKVFGASDREIALLESAFSKENMKWIWVLVKASGSPQPLVRELDLASFIFKNADAQVESAIEAYAKFTAEFGSDRDWPPRHSPEVWSDTDFPSWAFN
jgi:hypothetical protein